MLSTTRNDLDTAIIRDFTKFEQSTHSEIVCSSVGMALRTLAYTYVFNDANREHKFEELRVENFVGTVINRSIQEYTLSYYVKLV
jgi:hypothetical protein